MSFSEAASLGEESLTNVTLSITLSEPVASTVTVQYAVEGGTGVDPDDFLLNSGVLTFTPGSTSASIPFEVKDDAETEPSETILVALSSPTNALLGIHAVHVYTIRQSDVEVAFQTSATDVNESDGDIQIAVVLPLSPTEPARVDFAVSGGTAEGGGVDYTVNSGVLVFDPGTTVATFSVSVVDDVLFEDDETLILSLTNPSNCVLGTPRLHTITLRNDDPELITANVPWERVIDGTIDGRYLSGAYSGGLGKSRPRLVDIDRDGDLDVMFG